MCQLDFRSVESLLSREGVVNGAENPAAEHVVERGGTCRGQAGATRDPRTRDCGPVVGPGPLPIPACVPGAAAGFL